VEELPQQFLARTVTEAPRERLRVALGRRRVGQRAGVLVDSERERRRLQRGHGHFALGEDADEGRRERAVLGEDRVLGARPSGRLARVVIEDDLLDLRVESNRFELPEPTRMDRLDDDQPADGAELQARGLDQAELVGVQAVELANVPVERAREAADGLRVEAPSGEHRREGIEVGVPVGRDDGVCLHRSHSASARHESGAISPHSRVSHAKFSALRSPRGGGRANRTQTTRRGSRESRLPRSRPSRPRGARRSRPLRAPAGRRRRAGRRPRSSRRSRRDPPGRRSS